MLLGSTVVMGACLGCQKAYSPPDPGPSAASPPPTSSEPAHLGPDDAVAEPPSIGPRSASRGAQKKPADVSLLATVPPRTVAEGIAIASPTPGEVVSSKIVAKRRVTLSGEFGGELQVALDGHFPRKVRGRDIALGELVLEDEEIAPGLHRLAALATRKDGTRAVALAWFQVTDGNEGKGAEEAPPWGVLLLSPHGTFNGDAAADGVTIDAWSPDPKDQLTVELTGVGVHVRKVGPATPLRVLGLPSGDFRVRVKLATAGGPWAEVTRVITVNRDAPVATASEKP